MTQNDAAGEDFEWTIADRLRKVRERTGLSQKEFAKLIGISHGTASQYETNPIVIHKPPYLLAWSYYANVRLDWVVTGEGPMTIQPGEHLLADSSMPGDNDRTRSSLALPDHIPAAWTLATSADVA